MDLEVERQQLAGLVATEHRDIGMRSFVEDGPGQAAFRRTFGVRTCHPVSI